MEKIIEEIKARDKEGLKKAKDTLAKLKSLGIINESREKALKQKIKELE